jgi:uncharacterized membrane protein YczE
MISINKKIFILLIVTILVHFYVPFPYTDFDITKKQNFNKFYIATFTAFIVVFTDVVLNIEELTQKMFIFWVILLLLGMSVIYYIIANQFFISEEQYFLTMKENNEIDLNIISAISKNANLDEKGKIFTEKIKNNRLDEKKHLESLIT